MPSITPNLWFDLNGKEAAEFYCSVFPKSRITRVSYYGEAGPREPGTVLTVDFELDGRRFTAINGGPDFTFTEAVSFLIDCKDQAEIDYYWEKLGEGGEYGPCGWLKDKFGLSWQIIPNALGRMLSDKDPAKSQRAMAAMLQMERLDLERLQHAYDGA